MEQARNGRYHGAVARRKVYHNMDELDLDLTNYTFLEA
jgi:hypothetical protein